MGIYIKGMEMPKKCIECKLIRRCGKNDMDYVCMPARVYVEDLANAYKPRPDYCPLVLVPPHGRLIDADALEDNNITYYAIPVLKNVTDAAIREAELVIRLKDLDAAPTIIPTERKENKK